MIPNHSPLTPSESSGSGWVGVADSLVGGLVLFLIVALAAASQLNTANTQLTAAKNRLGEKENEVKSFQEQLSKKNKRIEELKQSKIALKAQVDKLSPKADILDAILKYFESTEMQIIAKLREMKNELDVQGGDVKVAKAELEELRNRKKVLDKILETFESKDDEIVARLVSLKAEWETAKIKGEKEIKVDRKTYSDLVQKAIELTELKESLKNRPKAAAVHAELLSLKGKLEKVVIILDFSGSMVQKRGKQESRWNIAKKYIENVCEYLDMEECVLIVFSNDIRVFGHNNTNFNNRPESPAFESEDMKRVGAEYTAKRLLNEGEKKTLFQLGQLTEKDLKSLKELKPFKLSGETNDRKLLTHLVTDLPDPVGGTNTLKAINAALQIEGVTNILLFTDGEPGLLAERLLDVERKKMEDSGVRVKPPDFPYQQGWIFAAVDERIEAYKKAGKEFPRINAIGIGDYFDNDLASFLRTLSEEKTGGSFQGR